MRARGVPILLTLLLAACLRTTYETVEVMAEPMQGQPQLRTARNLPQAFTVLTAARVAGDCPPRLSDPSLGTTLTLQQSLLLASSDTAGTGFRAVGDYAVAPKGRYGDDAGEGLRVDCQRLRALGVIPLGR